MNELSKEELDKLIQREKSYLIDNLIRAGYKLDGTESYSKLRGLWSIVIKEPI